MAAPDVGARAPRMPKLTYRNLLPADDSSPTTFEPMRSPGIRDSLEIRPCTTASTASAENRASTDTRSTTSSSTAPASPASSHGSTTTGSKTPKKKKNGVLNFLTMKEPSQLAFEQYAQSQRKQMQARSGSAASVGHMGVSHQKLPPNVPKVNSKWDGVPESLKSRKGSFSSKRSSSSSHGSRRSHERNHDANPSTFSFASEASHAPPNSLASPMASAVDVGQRRDSPSEMYYTPPLGSPVRGPLPQMTFFFPESPEDKTVLSASYADHPWSPPPPPPDLPTEACAFSDDEVTPDLRNKADVIFKKLKTNGHGFLAGEAQEVRFGDDAEDTESVPDSHDFLFELPSFSGDEDVMVSSDEPAQAISTSKAVQSPLHGPPGGMQLPPIHTPPRGPLTNFSRPRPRLPYAVSHKPAPPSLPTLYEVSVASTDTLASTDTIDTITGLPGLTKTISQDSDSTSTASSTRASSDPPMPHHTRNLSSRERLGLGGRIRMSEDLPWDTKEKAGKPKSSFGLRRIF